MTPASRAEDIVRQSVIMAKDSANDERKRLADEWLDYLDGIQLGYIRPNPEEDGGHFAKRPKIAFPFTDLIISDLSGLYKKAPTITVDDGQGRGNELLAEWGERAEDDNGDLNILRVDIDKKTRLLGNVGVRVSADAEFKYPRMDVFTPDQIDVIQDPLKPYKASAVILQESRSETLGDASACYDCWSAEEHWRIENGKVTQREPNKLGRVPVVFFGNTPEWQRFWSPGYGYKIVPQNKTFDQLWSSLIWLCVVQAHGQPWIKNPMPNMEPLLGPDTLVEIGKDGDFGFADIPSKITETLTVLETIVKRTYWICGLPVSRFTQEGAPESGYAYMVKNATVLEDRQARATIFRPKERTLWRLAFDVAAAYLGTGYTPKEIKVDFAEPDFPIPMNERMNEIKFKLETGLVSVADLMRQENPDLSPEDALEQVKANLAMSRGKDESTKATSISDIVTALSGGGMMMPEETPANE